MEQLIESKIKKQARQMIPQDNSPTDILILTRHLNVPEIDDGCWTNQECHLCHKHKYTMIFFHQDNQSLIEIKDPTVLQSFNSSGTTPVIYGLGQPQTMTKADVFTLLSISNDPRFVSSIE